jgi:hypothetical protein
MQTMWIRLNPPAQRRAPGTTAGAGVTSDRAAAKTSAKGPDHAA